MDKKGARGGDISYVIHSQDGNEKSFSDDIGNSYEIVDVKKKNKDTPDGVWKYFSFARNICDGSGDKVVCTICFEENEIKTYSKVTSSSNLWRHLQLKHNIVEEKKSKDLESESANAITEILREDGDDTVTYMEEVVVDNDKDLDDNENKYVVSGGADINVAIIEEIFKHPEIFDHRNHKSTKQDRDRQWDVIANHFKGTMHIENIKKVWKNIRDRYKKLRNKEMRTGVIPPPEKRYKYYDILNELDVSGVLSYDAQDNNQSDSERNTSDYIREPLMKKRRRRSSNEEEFTNIEYLHDRTVQFNDMEGDDPLFEDFEEIVSDAPPNKIIKTEAKSPGDGLSRDAMVSSQTPGNNPSTTSTTASSPVDDEYTLFGKLIAEKLRRMPKQRANRLEMKVMALLLIGDE